jgi:hypothetical protein
MRVAAWRKVAEFEAANLRAAKILLADLRYQGLPQKWAGLFLARRKRRKIMATTFDEGRYRVRILNQRFTESKMKKTLGFVLDFRVVCRLDQPESAVKSYQRDVTLWITEKTVKRVLHQLRELGYQGTELTGVDPDNAEGFHSFRDLEIELMCSHEPNERGELYEQWSFETSKQNLTDKTLLRQFDRLLKPEPEMTTIGADTTGITDSDVPF